MKLIKVCESVTTLSNVAGFFHLCRLFLFLFPDIFWNEWICLSVSLHNVYRLLSLCLVLISLLALASSLQSSVCLRIPMVMSATDVHVLPGCDRSQLLVGPYTMEVGSLPCITSLKFVS